MLSPQQPPSNWGQIILSALLLSVCLGSSSYFLAASFLLPVTDASDGQGHGPEKYSREWERAIAYKTERRQQWIGGIGLGVGALTFPASVLLLLRQNRE